MATASTASALRSFGVIALVVGGALVLASQLPDTAILTLTSIPVEPIVLVAAIPLAYLALGVVAGMDPRRYVDRVPDGRGRAGS